MITLAPYLGAFFRLLIEEDWRRCVCGQPEAACLTAVLSLSRTSIARCDCCNWLAINGSGTALGEMVRTISITATNVWPQARLVHWQKASLVTLVMALDVRMVFVFWPGGWNRPGQIHATPLLLQRFAHRGCVAAQQSVCSHLLRL